MMAWRSWKAQANTFWGGESTTTKSYPNLGFKNSREPFRIYVVKIDVRWIIYSLLHVYSVFVQPGLPHLSLRYAYKSRDYCCSSTHTQPFPPPKQQTLNASHGKGGESRGKKYLVSKFGTPATRHLQRLNMANFETRLFCGWDLVRCERGGREEKGFLLPGRKETGKRERIHPDHWFPRD